MPIYEFYCSACNTLFNFLSATVDTDRRPQCPRCGAADLERKPARFATLSSGSTSDQSESPLEEERLEQAMAAMAGELEAAGESEDPRRLGEMMRRLGEEAGLELGPAMEVMVERLASGEDPDQIDADLADLDSGGDDDSLAALFRLKRAGAGRAPAPPQVDDELYFF